MKHENRVEQLHRILDVEYAVARCFGQLSLLIRNGGIKNKFISFAETAQDNQCLLRDRLASLGVEETAEERACHACMLNPESFSLSGALNVGIELTDRAGAFYKELISSAQTEEERSLFQTLMKEKLGQRGFLKKERRFMRKEDDGLGSIESYCIDEVISKLWT